jgi:hypothetical protein
MTFAIWFLDKNHKHHHSYMISICFLNGLALTIIGAHLISTSNIFGIPLFLLGCLCLVCMFYYIIDKIRKKPSKKENKTNTKMT